MFRAMIQELSNIELFWIENAITSKLILKMKLGGGDALSILGKVLNE
jgi:hypothetical protein